MQLYAAMGNEICKWVKERIQKIRIKINIKKIKKIKILNFINSTRWFVGFYQNWSFEFQNFPW